MESETPQFNIDQVIWAKVTGHPWWPGVIASINFNSVCQIYRVDFFGYPPSHSQLPSNKIIKYQSDKLMGFNEQKGRLSPSLKTAIKQANQYYNTLQKSKDLFPSRKIIPLELPCESVKISDIQQKKQDNNGLKAGLNCSQNEQHCNHKKHKIIKKRIMRNKSAAGVLTNAQSQKSIYEQQNKQQKSKQQLNRNYNKRKLIKQQKQSKFTEISQLLEKYRLEKISNIDIQRSQQQTNKTMKFLYKFCRQFYSRNQSMQIALENKGKIQNLKQIKQFIRTHKAKNSRKSSNNDNENLIKSFQNGADFDLLN